MAITFRDPASANGQFTGANIPGVSVYPNGTGTPVPVTDGSNPASADDVVVVDADGVVQLWDTQDSTQSGTTPDAVASNPTDTNGNATGTTIDANNESVNITSGQWQDPSGNYYASYNIGIGNDTTVVRG